MTKLKDYFSKGEIILWSSSVMVIIISFCSFDRTNYMTLCASLIGVTSLIFNAKGNPFGQLLMVVFSLLYGIISYTFSYYGEMITYLGMTMPMAVFALISWLKNPFHGNKAEVKVNSIGKRENVYMWIGTLAITFIFYLILEYFNTANIIPSTISVTTSFLAVYLTFRRSPYFALAYAANDIVLIILWVLASVYDIRYISVVVCFLAFFVNDIYGFVSWRKMKIRQQGNPYVIVAEPSDKLLELQAKGYCVLAELKHLQGLRDEEVAEAICKEEAVTQYEHVCIDASQLPQAYFRRIWCRHIGEPVLIAETERLVIRESVEEDAKAFWELYQDEACGTYLEMPPVELCGDMKTDVAEYRRYIAQYREGQYAFFEYGMWSVVEKASGQCVGRAGLEMQGDVLCLGYAILPQYRGKGYATEACVAVLDYCKECEYAEEVFVNISEENIASKKVYEKVRAERDILKKIQ